MQFKVEELNKEELIKIIKKQDEEIQRLERELKKYKNPNTPSSAHPHLKPNTMGIKAMPGAKRGAPNHHPGTTRS